MKIEEKTKCPICKTELSRTILILDNPRPGYSARVDNYFDCPICDFPFVNREWAVRRIKELLLTKNKIPSCYWPKWMKNDENLKSYQII